MLKILQCLLILCVLPVIWQDASAQGSRKRIIQAGSITSYSIKDNPERLHSLQRISKELDQVLSAYQLYELDPKNLYRLANGNDNGSIQFSLSFGGDLIFNLSLVKEELRTDDYTLLVDGKSDNQKSNPETITYRSTSDSPFKVRATISDNLFAAQIQSEKETYFVEPLNWLSHTDQENVFALYRQEDIIQQETFANCVVKRSEGPVLTQIAAKKMIDNASGVCRISRVAMACDKAYMDLVGITSVPQMEARFLTILNYAQQWFVEFNIEHHLARTYVSTSVANDPVPGTITDLNTIISTLASWGEVSLGFGDKEFDIGVGLFGRNDLGGTDGAAYLNTICTRNAYIILAPKTGTSSPLNHELGHIYGAPHLTATDCPANNCLMKPGRSGGASSWVWGPSASVITQTIADQGSCLKPCQPISPTASFSADVTFGCETLKVQFSDQSLDDPTSWEWSFGDGGTSTLQNPTHTYLAASKYTVSLKVSNTVGSNVSTKTSYINIGTGILSAPLHVGPADTSLDYGMGGFSSQYNRWMYFKVIKPIRFYSIRVYTGDTAGKREFFIADTTFLSKGSGTKIYLDTIVYLPAKSSPVVILNFNLAPGDYCLLVNPTNKSLGIVQNLWRSQGNLIDYPYESSDGSISIYNNGYANNVKATPYEWYVGYDWVIQPSLCIPTGISDISNSDEDIFIFPTIGSGMFTIKSATKNEEKVAVEVYNLFGEKVYTNTITSGNNKTQLLDLSEKANGVYIVRIIGEAHQSTQRIVKE